MIGKFFRVSINDIVALTLLCSAIAFAFFDVPKTFFQQDEWQYFGINIYSLSVSHPLRTLVLPQAGELTHFFPLATLFFFFEYLLFKMKFPFYVYVNIILHVCNSAALYFFLRTITKKRNIAFWSALLFAVGSIAHQPVSWIAAGIGTLESTFLSLVSLSAFVSYIEKKSQLKLFIVVVSFMLSLLFKEISLFLFFVYPMTWILYEVKKKKFFRDSAFVALTMVIFFYILLRLFFLVSAVRSSQPEIGDVSHATAPVYVYRLLMIPLKGFSQSLVPANILIHISDAVIHLAYPQFIARDGAPNPHISQSIVFDLVTYGASVLGIAIAFWASWQLRKQKEFRLEKCIYWTMLFIFVSVVPFIFIPGKAGYFSIFEPRNLYLTSIGTSGMIVIGVYGIWKSLSKRPWFFYGILLMFALYNMRIIRHDVKSQVTIGTLRKNFLISIQRTYPTLPNPVVFYTESDTSYYGLPQEEHILPVQSGFGRMLMVWYQQTGQFPGCLYESQFLHDLISEGYRYCDGRGFGYVRRYDTLVSVVFRNGIAVSHVIAYAWDSKVKKFTDITKETQVNLRKSLEIYDKTY